MDGVKENEVELWTVTVGNLPILPKFLQPKGVREAVALIKEQEGFVAIYPQYPWGTLLLFDTENNAKGARNILRFRGIQCGDNICKVYADKRYLEGRNGK